MEVSWNRDTPCHHPFEIGIVQYKLYIKINGDSSISGNPHMAESQLKKEGWKNMKWREMSVHSYQDNGQSCLVSAQYLTSEGLFILYCFKRVERSCIFILFMDITSPLTQGYSWICHHWWLVYSFAPWIFHPFALVRGSRGWGREGQHSHATKTTRADTSH